MRATSPDAPLNLNTNNPYSGIGSVGSVQSPQNNIAKLNNSGFSSNTSPQYLQEGPGGNQQIP